MDPKFNFYRTKELSNGKILLALDSGDWIALSKEKFDLIRNNCIESDPMLNDLLQDKGIILTKKSKEKYIYRLRKRYNHLFKGPSLYIVAVTEMCNIACKYCHANAKCINIDVNKGISKDISEGINKDNTREINEKSENMALETAKKTVDFIFKTNNSNIAIEFQGGEPLLNFEIVKFIISYAKEKNKQLEPDHKKNLKFSMVTNLIAMDDTKLKFLMQYKVGLCTSLDGPKYVHDKNRSFANNNGTHDIVTKWIKKIKSDNKYPLEALMVTTKHSLPYPKEIVDEYLRLGFDNIQIRPMLNLGYAQENTELSYSADEYIQFWKTAMDYIIKVNQSIIKINNNNNNNNMIKINQNIIKLNQHKVFIERFSKYIFKKFYSNLGAELVDLNSPCGACISTLAFNHKGEIFTCDEGRQYEMFRLGDVNIEPSNLFESNQCQSMIKASVNDCLLCDNCVWKPFCGICPVCNYVESGNLIPILSKNDRCKILKAQFEFLMEKVIDPQNSYNKIFINWIKEY